MMESTKEFFAYSKKIYDAVHGFIRFNALERDLIDSIAFQRLHHIRQLGIAFLVYPGATHTRFEHSLGTMEVATRIFEHLLNKQMPLAEPEYWKQIVRLAALCHDLGHLPFSHDAESAILGKESHEQWTVRIIQSELLQPVWNALAAQYPHRIVAQDVARIAVGEKKWKEMGGDAPFSSWEKILSEIITADFFGADRIDYLLRDAKCTGVSYGTFDYHQLIEMLCILPSSDSGSSLSLGVEGNGIESCEALLLARHFMHQRVYQYSSVQACKFHMKRFMQSYYEKGNYLDSLEGYLSVSDNEILSALRSAALDPQAVGHSDAAAIVGRKGRIRPIEIDPSIGEDRLKEIVSALNIPRDALFWNISKKTEKMGLSFPVLMPSGSIVDANSCSQVRIPSGKKSWIFVLPEVEKAILSEITKGFHV
jgi:HD superfamily phosphohydrolase